MSASTLSVSALSASSTSASSAPDWSFVVRGSFLVQVCAEDEGDGVVVWVVGEHDNMSGDHIAVGGVRAVDRTLSTLMIETASRAQ